MSPLFEQYLFFILAGTAILAFVSGWVALYFFNKWQIKKLLQSDAPFYPNKESRYETIDGVKLHYVCHGSGPDILLLHGIAANIYCWRLLIPLLERNFRVWAVDIKGFGLSDKPDDNYDLQSQASLLVEFARRHEMKNLTVVGSSMGGAIAAEVAIQWSQLGNQGNQPHRPRLALIDSAHDPRVLLLRPRRYRLLKKMLSPFVVLLYPLVNPVAVRTIMRHIYGQPRLITNVDIASYIYPYVDNVASHSAFFAAVECMFDEGLVERIKAAAIPLLIVWGLRDRVINVRFGEELHRVIPSSKLLVHPTAGHHVQEEDPQWLAENLAAFIFS